MENNIQDQDQNEIITQIVSRVLKIEDITWGTKKQQFIVRFRGRLYMEDTAAAYDRLSEDLKGLDITPMFRLEDGKHAVVLVSGMPKPRPSNPWINLVLFVITLLSVMLTGALYGLDGPIPTDPLEIVSQFVSRGWPFALSLIAILGAHEFGHYLAGRYHGLNVTLPYFIPLPFSPFGTLGAFINMKEIPKNRRMLLDIGIAGPFAGLVVAVPVLLLGLSLSNIDTLPFVTPENIGLQLEGNSIVYLLSKFLVFGQLLPAPSDYGNLPPVLYWLRYFFTGRPLPLGGLDVMLHPVAWAGWAGLLVTGLNLIPVGQLDGGHVLYVLFGKRFAKRIYPFILVLLIALGFIWTGWWLWAFLLFFLGRVHAEPLDQITTLDDRRKILAVLALIVFFFTITPVPLILI
ncbi:MAG: site-2 protease family protein [Anaerolineaceae bacterium]|nr:site-2 protease family protein [Anaerolineaceae bacterium]